MARRNSYRGKYKMTKNQYLSAKYYALRYNEWVSEYQDICNTAVGITYSDMPKGSLNTDSQVEEAAIKASKVHDKIKLIEDTVIEVEPELYEYLLKAVTNTDITYHQLRTLMNIPCGKNLFSRLRQKFYWLLYQKI